MFKQKSEGSYLSSDNRWLFIFVLAHGDLAHHELDRAPFVGRSVVSVMMNLLSNKISVLSHTAK